MAIRHNNTVNLSFLSPWSGQRKDTVVEELKNIFFCQTIDGFRFLVKLYWAALSVITVYGITKIIAFYPRWIKTMLVIFGLSRFVEPSFTLLDSHSSLEAHSSLEGWFTLRMNAFTLKKGERSRTNLNSTSKKDESGCFTLRRVNESSTNA